MECACININCCDGEIPDVYNARRIMAARKEHKCHECGRTISPGEPYESVQMLVCGEWDGFNTCNDCLSLRDALFCGEWYHGGVLSDVEAFVDLCGPDDLPWSKFARLTPAAKTIVFDRIEYIWGGWDE